MFCSLYGFDSLVEQRDPMYVSEQTQVLSIFVYTYISILFFLHLSLRFSKSWMRCTKFLMSASNHLMFTRLNQSTKNTWWLLEFHRQMVILIKFLDRTLGGIHILRRQDFGLFWPPLPPFVDILFSKIGIFLTPPPP